MSRTREISRGRAETTRFQLSIEHGPDAPGLCPSSGVELTIGTAKGVDLRLSDPAVSRHHCSLTVTAQGVELRDLGSTNGTTLGGYRVNSGYVTSGAIIGVGETLLRFEVLDEQVRHPVSRRDRFGAVLGRSLEMRRLFAIAERVAPSDATILVEGETGTGKGVMAEAIHGASARSEGPFVVIDCAALPARLLESELFGHEIGSFTGARSQRIGLLEAAAGGTVFLDEIGELAPQLQPKLLRAVERREIRRVGSNSPIGVDVRFIAATNRDLRREVNRGAFRSDLFYRLSTVRMVLPPLRERREDIPLIASHIYRQIAPDPDTHPPAELLTALQSNDWPGNVRELASAVERSMITDDPELWNTDGGRARSVWGFDPGLSFRAAKERATGAWEVQYLEQLIAHTGGNVSMAARVARMDRSHLRTLLRRHGIAMPARTDDSE